MGQIDTFERLTGLEGTIKKNKNSHEISTRAKKKLESQNNADALAISILQCIKGSSYLATDRKRMSTGEIKRGEMRAVLWLSFRYPAVFLWTYKRVCVYPSLGPGFKEPLKARYKQEWPPCTLNDFWNQWEKKAKHIIPPHSHIAIL